MYGCLALSLGLCQIDNIMLPPASEIQNALGRAENDASPSCSIPESLMCIHPTLSAATLIPLYE